MAWKRNKNPPFNVVLITARLQPPDLLRRLPGLGMGVAFTGFVNLHAQFEKKTSLQLQAYEFRVFLNRAEALALTTYCVAYAFGPTGFRASPYPTLSC